MIIKKHFFTLLELMISLALTTLLLTTVNYLYLDINSLNSKMERLNQDEFEMRYAENRLIALFANTQSEYQLKENFIFFTSGDLNGLLDSGQPSLLFVFDAGMDIDEAQVGSNLARLYVSKEKQLCLAIWPIPEQDKPPPTHIARRDFLLNHIEKLSFSFYNPPARDREQLLRYHKDRKYGNVQAKASQEPVQSPEASKKNQKGETEGKNQKPAEAENQKPLEGEAGPIASSLLVKEEWSSEWRKDYGFLPAMIKIQVTRHPPGQPAQEITFAFPLPHSTKLILYDQRS